DVCQNRTAGGRSPANNARPRQPREASVGLAGTSGRPPGGTAGDLWGVCRKARELAGPLRGAGQFTSAFVSGISPKLDMKHFHNGDDCRGGLRPDLLRAMTISP